MILLKNRTVLKISGADARKFLQGLITNDINKVSPDNAIYAALQTPQGKYLFDFVIYQIDEDIILDIENARAAELSKKLNIYKLRSAVHIEQTDHKIYSDSLKGIADPRHDKLGKRLVTKNTQTENGEFEDYEALRLNLGIPETGDLIPDKSFIIQNNFEQLNAIDYKKGCYVGQEIIARVKYKGNVSKQIFKVTGEAALPEFGSVIMSGEKLIGEMRSSLGKIGLAQCIVDADTNAGFRSAGQIIKLQKPDYI